MRALARLVGTFFFVGLTPKAPGTAGSAAAIAIAWWLHSQAGVPPLAFGVYAVLLLGPASWAAGRVAEDSGTKDPQIVVIDEVVGQWITLAGASALNWKSFLAGFVLFRAFDMWKPTPVRQLENVPGGAGIVLDDAMAGVYGAVALYAAGRLHLY